MPLDDILSRCLARWTSEGIPLAPPVAEEEIRRAWQGFGQAVSEDVLRLYRTVGGFAEYVFDEEFSGASGRGGISSDGMPNSKAQASGSVTTRSGS